MRAHTVIHERRRTHLLHTLARLGPIAGLLAGCGATLNLADAETTDVARRDVLDAAPDATLDDAATTDAAPDAQPFVDASTDARPAPTLATVSHEREFRGVWVATVSNINFPSRTGLTAAAMRAELVALLEVMEGLRLNVLVFQIRPEGDALYRSTLEPWSRFLTGRQGGDPGFDPLEFVVTEAHRRGIEVHAWLNPYRAKSNAASAAVAPHISVAHPEAVVTYNNTVWMDPGQMLVQDHTASVVEDVVRRYDIDGVHFDDYFYPYPDGTEFPDSATYMGYRAGGGTLARADWRRDNVNRMVRRISESVAAIKDHVRFGISPFGIYRPGMPAGITGLDQYAAIFADPVRWMNEGWVEYLVPQLYWPTTQTAQAYGPLTTWWGSIARGGRYVFIGNNLSQLGSSSAWTVGEFRAQMDITRAHRDRNVMGNVFFTIAPFASNRSGIADVFRDEYYTQPALTPTLAPMRGATLAPPDVTLEGRTLSVRAGASTPMRAWVVYREGGSGWVIDRVVPSEESTIELTAGRWAVSEASRYGVESQGVVVEVP